MKRRYSSFLRRPPLGETMRANRALMKAMIHDPEQLARFEADCPESMMPALPKKRGPATIAKERRDAQRALPGVDIDAIHRKVPLPLEAQVLRAVADLLQAHPRVLFAIRQNSGAASYEAKSGRYAPINFYSWIRRPAPMTLPDIWGMLITGRPFFFEVKRAGWKQPCDERERRQAAFLSLASDNGALAAFVTDAKDADALLG